MEHQFEGMTWTLRARCKGGEPAPKSVKIVLTGDTAGLSDTEKALALTPQEGSDELVAEWTVILPVVDPMKPSHTLRANATLLDGEDKPLGTANELSAVTVWPRTITLSAVGPDGTTRPGARLLIKQVGDPAGQAVALETGEDSVALGRPAAIVSITVLSPHKLAEADPNPEQVGGKLRVQKFTVLREVRAVFGTPFLPAGGAVRQWVNLGVDAANPDQGHGLTLKVGAEDPALADEGSEVFVKVVFDRKVPDRFDPRSNCTVLICGGDGDDFDDAVWSGTLKLDANKTASFGVDLGIVGGDTCTITIGGVDGRVDARLVFENWRKLYYELIAPDWMTGLDVAAPASATSPDLPVAIKRKVDERLAQVFIVYEKKAAKVGGEGGFAAGTVFDAEYFGPGAPKALVLGPCDLAKGRTHPTTFDHEDDKRTVNIWLAHEYLSPNAVGRVSPGQAPPPPTLDLLVGQTSAAGQPCAVRCLSPADRIVKTVFTGAGTDPSVDLQKSFWIAQPPKEEGRVQLEISIRWEQDHNPNGVGDGVYLLDVKEVPQQLTLTFEKEARSVTSLGAPRVTQLTGEQQQEIQKWCLGRLVDASKQKKKDITITLGGQYGVGNSASDQRKQARFQAVQSCADKVFQDHRTPHPGRNPDTGDPRRGALQEGDLQHINAGEISVTLPTGSDTDPGRFVGQQSGTTCLVFVALAVRTHDRSNGAAVDGRQVLVLRPDDDAGAVAATVCHELGHLMGLAVFPDEIVEPDGVSVTSDVDQRGDAYRHPRSGEAAGQHGLRNGHTGYHCASGLSPARKAQASYDGIPLAERGTCIMWGAGDGTDRRQSFCATCKTVLLARSLHDIKTHWLETAPPGKPDARTGENT
ncbi:MAG: hypothetical protein H6739_15760 [Alphaproteobacteria bacterium]|nr:hypothetical protein [Alphaproteobacteria bacterium]